MSPPLAGAFYPLAATLATGLVVFSFLWLIHGRRRDAGVVDFWWAGGFAAAAWIELAWRGVADGVHIFVTAAVTLWAIRLTVHLVARHRARGGVEDARYARLRAAGGPGWPRRNLVTVFWLQAVIQWLLAAPIHAVMLLPATTPLPGLTAIGALLFLTGFAIETIADGQLAAARRRQGGGGLVTHGLWAWSRHPNYFGEAVLWWGLGLVAVGATGAWYAMAAPILLTWLLVKVSGLPPLEAELARRPGWDAYAAATPAFLPWPPRRGPDEAEERRQET